MKNLNNFVLNGKKLYVGYFVTKAEREAEKKRQQDKKQREQAAKYQGVNLFIKNLDDSIDDERLRREFSKFGNITSAKVCSDHCSIIHAETRRHLVI